MKTRGGWYFTMAPIATQLLKQEAHQTSLATGGPTFGPPQAPNRVDSERGPPGQHHNTRAAGEREALWQYSCLWHYVENCYGRDGRAPLAQHIDPLVLDERQIIRDY